MENRKQPVVRFAGYTDDWEERKLGEIFKYEQPTKYIVKSTDYEDSFETPVLTAGQSFILGYTNETEGIKEASNDNPIIIFDDFTTGSHYVGFRFKVKSSAMKLLYLNNGEYDDFYFMFNVLKNVNYVPQSHERHWISKFSEFEVKVPNRDEQTKIGSFFKHLDNTIALHQHKLDLLKEQKKGFLQKMFPKAGANTPEVRFAEFADDWEQRKLKDMSESFEYGLNSSAIPFDGENKYLRITDIDDSSNLFKQDSLTSPDADLESSANYLLKKGDILFARTGASVGKSYRYQEDDGKVYYAGFLIRARISPQFDSEFIFQNTLTSPYNNFIKLTSQRSGQPGVNAKEYGDFEIYVPKLEEQQKIGAFFKQLDDTIALNQKGLELLKETKKGFLQKMFV